MSKQRFARQTSSWYQQIIQNTSQLYLDQQLNAQKYIQLQKKQPQLSEQLSQLIQRKMETSDQLYRLNQMTIELQEKLQEQLGPEPTFPMELAIETYLLK